LFEGGDTVVYDRMHTGVGGVNGALIGGVAAVSVPLLPAVVGLTGRLRPARRVDAAALRQVHQALRDSGATTIRTAGEVGTIEWVGGLGRAEVRALLGRAGQKVRLIRLVTAGQLAQTALELTTAGGSAPAVLLTRVESFTAPTALSGRATLLARLVFSRPADAVLNDQQLWLSAPEVLNLAGEVAALDPASAEVAQGLADAWRGSAAALLTTARTLTDTRLTA
jgi:hypothetical protein